MLGIKKYIKINFFQLLSNSMHIGHSYKVSNLMLDRFFVGRRYSIIILNLLTSVINLRRASLVLFSVVRSYGYILFVVPAWYNTPIFFYLRRKVFNIMEPLWANAWISGFLTNHKRVLSAYLTYVRAERLTRKQKKVLSILSLDVTMFALPGAVISLNRKLGNLAVVEATAMRIPVIGLLDSNVSGNHLMFPIPSNDDSYKVMFFYVLLFSKIILVAKMTRFLSFTNFYKKYHVIGDETKQLRVSNKINLYNLLTEYKLKRKFV